MRRIRLLMACAPICLVALNGCGSTETSRSDPKPSSGETKTREQFEGFAFELPDQWMRVAPDQPKTKAMLLLGAERWNLAEAMIKVDVGKPAVNDSRALAQQFADQIGGVVDEPPIIVDGEGGVRIKSMKAAPSLAQPSEVIIVFRDGRAFMIMGSAKTAGVISEPINTIVSTWKWD